MAYNICKYGDGSGGGGGDERPDGSTITPVSDVPTWLRCGGLGSKGYTTLPQVLKDSTTLDGLMSDANAVNYLVRSTSWISEITGFQSAMTYIGANDYAAYKLLSNNLWRTSICDSTYFESVLNVKVPTMASNTSPSGECFASSVYNTNYPAWKAFNGVVDSGWNCNTSEYNTTNQAYIGYTFTSVVNIFVAKFVINMSTAELKDCEIRVIANNNSSDQWYEISDVSTSKVNPSKERMLILNYFSSFKRFALRGSFLDASNRYFQIAKANFYGRIFGNVQSWLKAGKIDKNYTTLEQVLSDTSTLQALMASTDAVDYLSACGRWADTICANQSAMNYIGLNNYAANTLLADACWLNAICDSTYFENVLNVKVPTMTSNTTPSGVVSASAYVSGNDPWRGFDGTNTQWFPTTNSNYTTSDWLQYQFTSKQKIYAIGCRDNEVKTLYLKLSASNNNSTFTQIGTCTAINGNDVMKCHCVGVPSESYLYYRIGFTATCPKRCLDYQLFGRQDV